MVSKPTFRGSSCPRHQRTD